MKRIYTGSLLAFALTGYGAAANAQQDAGQPGAGAEQGDCQSAIDDIRQQLENRELRADLEQSIRDVLDQAEGSQNCRQLVSSAERALEAQDEGQAQNPEQQAAARQQQGGQQSDATRVEVEQQAADVNVDAPPARIEVEQRPAQVRVEQQSPEVRITQPEPEVTVNQPEPEVSVTQAEPDVQVNQPEPQVQVSQAGEPEVEISQSEPDVSFNESDRERQAADDADAGRQAEDLQRTRAATITEQEARGLVGQTIESRTGEELGEVTAIVESETDGEFYAVADVGGFLGVGEERKAIPFDALEFDAERNLVSLISEEELEALPAYEEGQYRELEGEATAAAAGDAGSERSFADAAVE